MHNPAPVGQFCFLPNDSSKVSIRRGPLKGPPLADAVEKVLVIIVVV
jgi:hypothetical protein